MFEAMDQLAARIARHLLARWQASGGAFPAGSQYGEAFAVALWRRYQLDPDGEATNQALIAIQAKQADPSCHYEFITFALESAGRRSPFDEYQGTKVVNWILLRQLCELLRGCKPASVHRVARRVLKWQQRPSGLICDNRVWHALVPLRRGELHRSTQYHAACLFFLAEILSRSSEPAILSSFDRGVGYLERVILPNGDALYVGRGQEQIFGYGAVLASLAFQASRAGGRSAESMQRVLSFLLAHEEEPGAFPLVVGGAPAPTGWYSYNNHDDYLAFAGFCVSRAAEWLRDPPTECGWESSWSADVSDKPLDVIRFDVGEYSAVLGVPGGFPPNDLPWPAIGWSKDALRVPLAEVQPYLPRPTPSPVYPTWSQRGVEYSMPRDAYELRKTSPTGASLEARNRGVSHCRQLEFDSQLIRVEDRLRFSQPVERASLPLWITLDSDEKSTHSSVGVVDLRLRQALVRLACSPELRIERRRCLCALGPASVWQAVCDNGAANIQATVEVRPEFPSPTA